MSTTGPENPAAAALAVARAPFTGRAWRELLFCAIEAPLGLCALVFPIALVALPSGVALLSDGGPVRSGPAHPAALVSALGAVTVFLLLALLFLAPRTGRGLGAAHRRLAAWLLGEPIAAPAAKAANVPGKVAIRSAPNGVSAATGRSCVPAGWLRNSGHQNG